MVGTLYLCATPIGNLEDITLRVLRILKEVDLIAAEDTRHSRILLEYYDIHTPMTSYHEHNKYEKAEVLIRKLQEGDEHRAHHRRRNSWYLRSGRSHGAPLPRGGHLRHLTPRRVRLHHCTHALRRALAPVLL